MLSRLLQTGYSIIIRNIVSHLQRPAVLGEFDDLPVGAGAHVVLLLGLGDVVTGVVGTDPHVHVGVVAATLDQVGLDPLLGDLVRGIVRARDGLLPRADRHGEIRDQLKW